MNHLRDHHVLVLGLGHSGLAMARWCTRHGARVTVADTRPAPPQLATLHAECPAASFISGAFDDALFDQAAWTLVARSPGLAPAQLAAVNGWAKAQNVAVVGELDLFAQALSDLAQREHKPYTPKVLAITGTNGKTTVTSLTGLLLQRAGANVAVAGNIGPALLDVLSQALDAEAVAEAADAQQAEADAAQADEAMAGPVDAPAAVAAEPVPVAAEEADTDAAEDEGPAQLVAPPLQQPQPPHLPAVWVLELSSFQLDGVAGGAWDRVPTAATVLNITEDHLDWHGSLTAYAQAKAAIFGTQALMLLNRDDLQVMAMKPALVTVKVSGRNRQQPARPYATFGLDAPVRPGDWGIEAVNGMEWLVRALALDETRKRGRAADTEDEVYFQRMMPVDALRIRGRHNAANALAALALATSTGAALGAMLHGLREYRGEPHRVEPVGMLDDVEYFDDSKGTNVGATLAAIKGLGADRRLVVILGGDGKGQDFNPLTQALVRHARAVVLIGRDAPLIRHTVAQAMAQAQLPLLDAASLNEAVALAAQQARPGDAVLMSPACASLDMFDNYVHRARVFVAAVSELAAERGMDLESFA
ncbi:UDP-N-acetylmuramoyl-L-alanine--D-glutamate ligase [Hydrogenophaga sp.]|uniref:UDP-N-acetylmuramoyl-L-alanine--D-glutamate ligase n=1 Tax=Hydrogenophaga sp. TaxID=1904254 RepID=UPI003F6D61B5